MKHNLAKFTFVLFWLLFTGSPQLAAAEKPPRQRLPRIRIIPPKPCTKPALKAELSPASVCPGKPVTVSWKSSDPKATVTIDGLGSNFTATGDATFPAWASQKFVARAENSCGASKEVELKLTVGEDVQVRSFRVTPPRIDPGQRVDVAWEVEGADIVNIEGLGKNLPFKGARELKIDETTRFTLTARGKCGWVEERATTTCPFPEIVTFAVVPGEAAGESCVELDVAYADSWSVTSGEKKLELPPPTNTFTRLCRGVERGQTLVLTAKASCGSVRRSLKVD